jgi:hypothetical protein
MRPLRSTSVRRPRRSRRRDVDQHLPDDAALNQGMGIRCMREVDAVQGQPRLLPHGQGAIDDGGVDVLGRRVRCCVRRPAARSAGPGRAHTERMPPRAARAPRAPARRPTGRARRRPPRPPGRPPRPSPRPSPRPMIVLAATMRSCQPPASRSPSSSTTGLAPVFCTTSSPTTGAPSRSATRRPAPDQSRPLRPGASVQTGKSVTAPKVAPCPT